MNSLFLVAFLVVCFVLLSNFCISAVLTDRGFLVLVSAVVANFFGGLDFVVGHGRLRVWCLSGILTRVLSPDTIAFAFGSGSDDDNAVSLRQRRRVLVAFALMMPLM